ncbi:MAG: ATP-dependent protease, partial [Akkermansiaceae bacterium]|nr:ATP-dependent protease [Akkermansiaceae bacterium]
GLTGEQGVAIPRANLQHTILRPDVVEAVREGRFHIWPVEHVDQALELLADRPAGDLEREGTIHHAVAKRLRKLAGILKEQGPGTERTVEHVEKTPEPQADP